MTLERMAYQDARSMMKPGDVIAFGGKGHFSDLIKFATRSDVSHVGVVLQTRVVEDDTGRFFNQREGHGLKIDTGIFFLDT